MLERIKWRGCWIFVQTFRSCPLQVRHHSRSSSENDEMAMKNIKIKMAQFIRVIQGGTDTMDIVFEKFALRKQRDDESIYVQCGFRTMLQSTSTSPCTSSATQSS